MCQVCDMTTAGGVSQISQGKQDCKALTSDAQTIHLVYVARGDVSHQLPDTTEAHVGISRQQNTHKNASEAI